jgi:hypothetical protein
MMSMLMMFAAFAIDIGFIVLTQAQLQNAADAAALAATLELKTADADLTQADIRARAIAIAKETALLNYAATRPVELYDADITLGNRVFDSDLQKWVTTEETDGDFGNKRFNTVRVNVAFDQPSGPRRELDLFFARVFDIFTAKVGGESRSHLTPRDLVFCIDISGSMFGDSGGNTPIPWGSKTIAWTELIFGPIYGTSRPDKIVDAATYKGNYKLLWEKAMTDGSFGTTAQRDNFLAMEFPAYTLESSWPTTEPWKHWKWRAFCDFAFCSDGGPAWNDPRVQNIYNGLSGQTKNLNVVVCTTMAWNSGDNTRIGPWSYTHFLVWSGYVPAIRGQQFYPRDANSDLVLDKPYELGYPDEVTDAPYPEFVGFYPRLRDLAGYQYTNLFEAGEFTGIYPGNIPAEPMSVVRQSTLLGIFAMIEAEEQGDQGVAFNQVGMVSFATMAHPDLNLSNKLQLTLRTANSRLTTYPGNSFIRPHGSGATNIGMGIKRSLQMLTDPDGRGRSFASKTIAMLTDGQPTYSIEGEFTDEEFNPATQAESLKYDPSGVNGKPYAEHWANECGEAGVTLHTIGLGSAGTGASVPFLEGLAERGEGTFTAVPSVDTETEREELRQLFIAIGKDKLGKLYLD